jgi:hypothetical protein
MSRGLGKLQRAILEHLRTRTGGDWVLRKDYPDGFSLVTVSGWLMVCTIFASLVSSWREKWVGFRTAISQARLDRPASVER